MTDRRTLRRRLLEVAPWLAATDVGPQALEAGPCDRCGEAPRLLPTCGPAGGRAVCRDCGRELGDDGWCAGHQAEGEAARAWAEQLPDRWGDLVTLWWIATGEVRAEVAPTPSDLLELAALNHGAAGQGEASEQN